MHVVTQKKSLIEWWNCVRIFCKFCPRRSHNIMTFFWSSIAIFIHLHFHDISSFCINLRVFLRKLQKNDKIFFLVLKWLSNVKISRRYLQIFVAFSEYMNFTPKGAFFSESEIRFSNLPISQKNYSKKLSWACNLKFPPISVNN